MDGISATDSVRLTVTLHNNPQQPSIILTFSSPLLRVQKADLYLPLWPPWSPSNLLGQQLMLAVLEILPKVSLLTLFGRF
jgi:hypothetical protein